MKIIFSRKGFDSSAGGFPSLIFPDGSLFSVPIPSTKDGFFYADLKFSYEGDSIQSILNDLTGEKIKNRSWNQCDYSLNLQRCHYDPMPLVDRAAIAFGQTGSSETHLRKNGVDSGDVFLFFGWFKQVEKIAGAWKFKYAALDIHLIWAWMRIGELIELDSIESRKKALKQFPYLSSHPHFAEWRKAPNRVYLSHGAGILPYMQHSTLTDCSNYQGRSSWALPRCFNQPQAWTYLRRFTNSGDRVLIRAPGRGQEFVLDIDRASSSQEKEAIISWLNNITE